LAPATRRSLAVDAHELLIAGADAGLANGRDVVVDDEAVGPDAALASQLGEAFAVGVGADARAERGGRAERDDVGCDVRGAAEHLVHALLMDHLDRGLGRDAVDAAVDVHVQQRVAEDEDVRAGATRARPR